VEDLILSSDEDESLDDSSSDEDESPKPLPSKPQSNKQKRRTDLSKKKSLLKKSKTKSSASDSASKGNVDSAKPTPSKQHRKKQNAPANLSKMDLPSHAKKSKKRKISNWWNIGNEMVWFVVFKAVLQNMFSHFSFFTSQFCGFAKKLYGREFWSVNTCYFWVNQLLRKYNLTYLIILINFLLIINHFFILKCKSWNLSNWKFNKLFLFYFEQSTSAFLYIIYIAKNGFRFWN